MAHKTAISYVARIRNPEKRRYALDLLRHLRDPFAVKRPDSSDYNLSYMGAQAVRMHLAELTGHD